MPNFSFEQEVFSLIKLKAKRLHNNLDNVSYKSYLDEIENEMFRLLVEYKKLEAQFAKRS